LENSKTRITCVVVNKEYNANNKDLTRPVMIVEVAYENGDEVKFVPIGVLLCETSLIKSAVGFAPGDILNIEGYLRDNCGDIYIEAVSISKQMEQRPGKDEDLRGRIALLAYPQRSNSVALIGDVNDNKAICQREHLTKGDLKKEDKIPLSWECNQIWGKAVMFGHIKESNSKAIVSIYYAGKLKED